MTDNKFTPVAEPAFYVTLKKPLKLINEEIAVIHVREPVLKDLQEAGFPIIINEELNTLSFDETAAPKMLQRLTGIPKYALDKLNASDAMSLFYGMRGFFIPESVPTATDTTI